MSMWRRLFALPKPITDRPTGRRIEHPLTEDLRKSFLHTRPDPTTGPPDIIDLKEDENAIS